MIKFFIYNKQIILNTILFIALILALVFDKESVQRDFFIGFATSIAFINFMSSFRSRNKEDGSIQISKN